MKEKFICAVFFSLVSCNSFATTLHGAKILSEEIKMVGNAKGHVLDVDEKKHDLVMNTFQVPSDEEIEKKLETYISSNIEKTEGVDGEETDLKAFNTTRINNVSDISHIYDISQYYCVGDYPNCFESLIKVEVEPHGSVSMNKLFILPYTCHKGEYAAIDLRTTVKKDDSSNRQENLTSHKINIVDAN